MNSTQYFKFIRAEAERIISLVEKKNNDYTSGSNDALYNLRGAEDLGLSPLHGLLFRMSDKFKRLQTFAKTGKLAVQNEGAADAFSDLIGYSFMGLALLHEDKAGVVAAPEQSTEDEERTSLGKQRNKNPKGSTLNSKKRNGTGWTNEAGFNRQPQKDKGIERRNKSSGVFATDYQTGITDDEPIKSRPAKGGYMKPRRVIVQKKNVKLVYNSISEAAEYIGMNRGSLSRALKKGDTNYDGYYIAFFEGN